MANVTINGLDIETLGIAIAEVPGWLTSAGWDGDTMVRLGRPGAAFVNERVLVKPFTIRGYISADDAATLRANYDKLLHMIRIAQPATVVFGDVPDRQIRARIKASEIEAQAPAFDVYEYDLTLRFDATENPLWEATSETTVSGITTTATALPMGTAPCFLQTRIAGPATNPTITLKNSIGSTIGTMEFTITLGSGDYLCVDHGVVTQSVYKNRTGEFNAGTSKIGRDTWTGGQFLTITEADYVCPTSSWPTISVSSGSMDVIYRKLWY